MARSFCPSQTTVMQKALDCQVFENQTGAKLKLVGMNFGSVAIICAFNATKGMNDTSLLEHA